MQTDQSRSPSPHAYEQYFQSEKLNIFSAGHYEFFCDDEGHTRIGSL